MFLSSSAVCAGMTAARGGAETSKTNLMMMMMMQFLFTFSTCSLASPAFSCPAVTAQRVETLQTETLQTGTLTRAHDSTPLFLHFWAFH